jgi:beta-lactamase class A
MRSPVLLLTFALLLLLVGAAACGTPEVEPEPDEAFTATPFVQPTVVAGATPLPTAALLVPRFATVAPSPTGSPSASCTIVRPDLTPTPAPSAPVDVSLTPGPRMVAGRYAPVAEPYEPLPAHADPQLEALILATLGPAVESYGVVVKDLQDGRAAAVNADRAFYAASLYKLLVMYEVFSQESRGLLKLDDVLVMTPYYHSFGLGPRGTVLCQEASVHEVLQAMMSISDNAAGVLLQDLVGAWNVNASMEALGLKTARMLTDDLPVDAADVALLLEAIARGEAVSEAASDAMLSLLLSERFDNGIVGGLPHGTTVAHKTGNWSNATHDVAIVYSPASTYVLVVLSDRSHDTRLTRALSAAVYEYFNNGR